jgi:hypothetical protein
MSSETVKLKAIRGTYPHDLPVIKPVENPLESVVRPCIYLRSSHGHKIILIIHEWLLRVD